MKKLMTMIAAVATAFGLYAADFAKHTIDFAGEGISAGQYDLSENTTTTGFYWTYDGQAKGDYTPSDDLKVESNVLTIKTGSKVLSRKFVTEGDAALSGTNLFFDSYINFDNQALDEMPTLPGGEKLALFVLDTTDPDLKATYAGTNLYVIAGYGNGGAKKLYQLNTKVDAAFLATAQRVTIKAYATALAAATRPGFMIYINGSEAAEAAVYMYDIANDGSVEFDKPSDELNPGNDYLGYASSAILPTLSNWAKNLKLFLSIDVMNVDTLTSVDFVGNAKISSVTLTDEQPGFIPADAKFVTIATDPTDLAYTVTVDGDEVTPVDGKIYGNGGEEVVITVTSGLTGKALTSTKGTVNDNVITYTFVVNDTITIAAVDAAAYVDGKAYATFDAALTAACAKEGAVLKLTTASTLDEALSIESCNNMTLDLAGQTITDEGSEIGVICVQNGALTITNSVPTAGGVTATAQNGIAVNNIAGVSTVAIYGGQFDGAVQNYNEVNPAAVTYTGISIFDGAFSVKPEGATIPSDKKKWCEEAEKVGGYWVLVDKPTEIDVPTAITGLVYDNTQKTGVNAGTGYTLTGNTATDAGEYTATATLKAGYIWSDKSTGTKEIKWSIAAKEVTPAIAFDPDTAEWVSGGSLPTPAVSFGADTLVLNTDYTVAWDKDYPEKNPTENVVVTYTVSPVTGSNYTFTEAKKTFTVTPAEEEEPVVPGEDITTDKTPAEINADPTLKEKLLNAPVGVETTKDYLDLFKAVDGTEPGKVKFVLTEAAEATLATEVANETKAIEVAKIADGTDTTIAIENATKGLYYTLNAAATLEGIAAVDEVLCTDGTVTFTKGVQGTTSDTARFFKVSVSATPAAE